MSSELQGNVSSNGFGISLVLILTVITSCVYLYRSMPKTWPIKYLCTSSVRSAHPVGFSTHRYSDRRTLNATLIQFIIPKIRRYLKYLHHPDKIRHVSRNFRFLISFDLVSNEQIALCENMNGITLTLMALWYRHRAATTGSTGFVSLLLHPPTGSGAAGTSRPAS